MLIKTPNNLEENQNIKMKELITVILIVLLPLTTLLGNFIESYFFLELYINSIFLILGILVLYFLNLQYDKDMSSKSKVGDKFEWNFTILNITLFFSFLFCLFFIFFGREMGPLIGMMSLFFTAVFFCIDFILQLMRSARGISHLVLNLLQLGIILLLLILFFNQY
jgi:hypothetical protein